MQQILLLTLAAHLGEFVTYFSQNPDFTKRRPAIVWTNDKRTLPELITRATLVIVSFEENQQGVDFRQLASMRELFRDIPVIVYAARLDWSNVYNGLEEITPDAPRENAFGIRDPQQRGAHYKDIVARSMVILLSSLDRFVAPT